MTNSIKREATKLAKINEPTTRTTVVNIKHTKKYDVYIGRGSKWGNPFKMKNKSDEERDRVCDLYETWFYSMGLDKDIHMLKGKILGCYCKPKRCHGDFLAKLANG
jgi:hypothetical protein